MTASAAGIYGSFRQARLGKLVWATSCESWYKNEAGKIVNNWGYSTLTYWRRTRRPDWTAFALAERGESI